MTMPRPILPGTTTMVTRRCTQRHFLLKPTKQVRQIFMYCLAIAAHATGVQIHVAVVMSNHYHLIVTDPLGQLPKFTGILNKYVAKCLNTLYGRWENFWAANESPSHVQLPDDSAVLEKSAYALANPVEAGIVAHGRQWPGIRLFQPGCYKVRRPRVFFRKVGPMPEQLSLTISPPPVGEGLSTAESFARVTRAAEQREEEIRAAFARNSRRFLGIRSLKCQSTEQTPDSQAPRRRTNPRVASHNKWHRIEVLQRVKAFFVAYRDAFARWRAGERHVLFPAGTYAMRVVYGVRCADT